MKNYIEFAQQIRWLVHENAELSYQEEKTSKLVCDELSKMGIAYERVKDCYGVVASIGSGDECIAIRADMDALPIEEQTQCEHACKSGVMHACGHDFHTACLLAFAKYLKDNEAKLTRRIKLLFQPAEEASPTGGARFMLDCIKDIDEIYGIHVWPDAKLGSVVIKQGDLMAASDHFYLDIEGFASHAAQPHKGIDALAAASDFVQGAYTFFARRVDAFTSNVLTIGTLQAGTRYNVLANSAHLEGTVRTYDPTHRDMIEEQLKMIAKGVDLRWGSKSVLRYDRGYPSLVNDAKCAKRAAEAAKKAQIEVIENTNASMCGEDFAVYLQQHKGAFLWLGVGGDYPLHHEKFLADERAFEFALKIYSNLAFE